MSDVAATKSDQRGSLRVLYAAAVIAGLSIAPVPVWILVNSYEPWDSPLVIAGPLLLTTLVLVAVATLQAQAGRRAMTFAPLPLATSSILVSIACCAIGFFGFVGGFIMICLLPFASVSLALAWVQPVDSWIPQTAALGVALLPFIVWFAGRADEYLSEALVSGATIALLVVAMWAIRRNRSQRPLRR